MTRPLIHPLKQGGSLTRVQPGRWEPVQRREQVAEIQLTEHVQRGKRPGISSIPSPWARLQLFRDAVVDEAHPSHADVVNDILDALELVLFQRAVAGLDLEPRRVDLDELQRGARQEQKRRVERFVETLRELAPDVPAAGPLEALTLVFNNGRLLFATSPFTLIFTPEEVRAQIPGYFVRHRPIRTLAERPPLLARYVRDHLNGQLSRGAAGEIRELQALKTILERQLDRASLGADEAPEYVDAQIFPLAGVSLQRVEAYAPQSNLALRPTRRPAGAERVPLVLDDSGAPAQQRYFSWLERPAEARADASARREVLPGTGWLHEWINPEHDFLVQKLIVLDTPLFPERVHGPAGGATELTSRVLLPLTRKFFQYFSAADVPRMLTVRAEGQGHGARVQVELKVPTAGGTVVARREYQGGAPLNASFSVWPGFVTAEPPEWRDYYLISYLDGQDVGEALEVQVGADGGDVRTQSFQRNLNTLVQHFERPPEVLFVRQRVRIVGETAAAEGAILPKMPVAPPPTKPAWTVAIDFGTSNTVVAYSDGTQRQTLDVGAASRFDLTRQPQEAAHVSAVLDTFFFPPSLEGRPFGTVVFRSLGADGGSAVARIPAVTANVPFSGEVSVGAAASGRHANEVVGDLKWGGGGEDSERLTQLFLHQVLQLVHAEARARGVRTDGMSVRWSFPSAFSLRRQNGMAARWEAMVREFDHARLGSAAPGADARAITGLDEGTAAMLYLQRDPAAQGNFGPNASYIKLTADVGGGTTDVAAYALGEIVFRNSILFGGRDLIGDGAAGAAQPGIFTRLFEWAQGRRLPGQLKRVIEAYPSQHTKFTYLVRHPWFSQERVHLTDESWFPAVQACILYFFGAIHYNIGLRLRGVTTADVRAPDYIFFGGNGSTYLNWLTEFRPWNGSPARRDYAAFFQALLEAGYGTALGHELTVLTSSKPKQEVALGLLEKEPRAVGSRVPVDPPVGEAVSLPGEGGTSNTYDPQQPLPTSEVAQHGAPKLRFERPFAEREIARFNATFQKQLATLGDVDPLWRTMAGTVRNLFGTLDERFYDAQVRRAIDDHLHRDDIGAVTLFVLEATATLRQLERRLVGGG